MSTQELIDEYYKWSEQTHWKRPSVPAKIFCPNSHIIQYENIFFSKSGSYTHVTNYIRFYQGKNTTFDDKFQYLEKNESEEGPEYIIWRCESVTAEEARDIKLAASLDI